MYSYGSSYSDVSYGSSHTTVSLPRSMPAGAVIGKGGQNIKMLQQRSGAGIRVSKSGTEVVISGGPAAVQAATRLLNQQIETFLASGGGYHHPLQVHYLLSSQYGGDASTSVNFLARRDEVAQAAGRREQLYELQPAGPARVAVWPAGASAGSLEALTAALSGARLGSSTGTAIHMAGQQPGVVQQLLAAAAQGAQHSPAFDEIKIRFNFGKALWYFPRTAAPHSWTIEEMRAKEIPTDVKSVFSNGVQASHISGLQDWLARKGFVVVKTKDWASAHLLHHGANAAYSLSFIKMGGGGLALRKAKTGTSKLFFLTLLNSSGQPDLRAKLLGQYHLQQGSAVQALLASIAAGATLTGCSFSRLQFPGLSAHDMSLDKERHKSKTIYLGSYSSSNSGRRSCATEIKVSVSKLLSDGCADGWEVAGTSPQVHEVLQGMLRRGSASVAQQAELAAHVDNLLAFARMAAAAVARP